MHTWFLKVLVYQDPWVGEPLLDSGVLIHWELFKTTCAVQLPLFLEVYQAPGSSFPESQQRVHVFQVQDWGESIDSFHPALANPCLRFPAGHGVIGIWCGMAGGTIVGSAVRSNCTIKCSPLPSETNIPTIATTF